MKRSTQALIIVAGSLVVGTIVLASALAWGPHQCKAAFPMVIGCAIGSYENLSGGLIAGAAALVAGWLAWSAVQLQIAAEERRASADRIEVEEILKADVDSFAEGLAGVWQVLEELDPEKPIDQEKSDAVIYGICEIAKPSWISSSRRMIGALGWSRRQLYEALLDELERLRGLTEAPVVDVEETLHTVAAAANYFESVLPDTKTYFEGFFRRSGKAWTIGDTVRTMAGHEI